MTNWTLARDYFRKVKNRRKALQVLFEVEGFDDVIREGQELVELLLKGILRLVGVDPPKWHDVGKILLENKNDIPEEVAQNLDRIMKFSSMLRKEREMSFCGDDDFIPSENYSREDADKCIKEIDWLIELVAVRFKNE